MLISYIFFSGIADKKLSYIKCIVIGTLLFEAGAIINLLFNNTIWINASVFLLINVAFAMLCFSIKMQKIIFYSALLVIFSTALEFTTIFIISVLFNSKITDYNTNNILLSIDAIISKALYFITCLLLVRIVKKDSSNSRFPISFYIFPISVSVSLLAFWYICAREIISETNQIVLAVISFLLFSATIFLFITYQHNIEKENQYIILQSELRRIQTEKKYYDILEHQNQQLMIYAHDVKKHLSAINDLNSNPLIEDYIKKMTDSLRKYSKMCQSGNMTLDVILNRYETECELKGISFLFDVRLDNLAFIDNFDLVTILDNLLDNSLEAAEKTKNKSITFEIDHRNSYTVIIISNSCEQSPIINNKQLITTKKDKSVHGLGLKSVSNTLKKYNGDIDWEFLADKKRFITTVMLRNQKMQK